MSGFALVNEQMDLIRRGALEVVPEEEMARKIERARRKGRPLLVKQGFDPTRPDLHIGHAVSLRKLRDFQELGHQVVFVVGDYTARIGDPTGRSELRPRLSAEEVAENARTYQEQVFQVLDRARTRVEFNSRWLEPLALGDLLELTAHYTVARMLEREDFRSRFQGESPISLVEFMYPLLQAYDSVALRADVELGGSDQRFNLLVARDIQARYGQEAQACVLMPLLRGTDGTRKMSKSYDNYVGIAQAPQEQYGRTLSIPDALLEEWIGMVTDEEAEVVRRRLEEMRESPYRAKHALAHRLVEMYHGREAADRAAAEFRRIFQQHAAPESLPEVMIEAAQRKALGGEEGEVGLARLLVHLGLAPSNTQAMNLIASGAVSVDGEKVVERGARVQASGTHLVQKGKRHFVRVHFA